VRTDDDRGASVVEFVMMSVLLVLLLFGVLQVGLYLYARNIVAAAAADGARYGADQGIDTAAGAARATQLISRGLNNDDAAHLPCVGSTQVDPGSGLAVATVRCRGRLKMIFLPLGIPLSIDVTSSSLKEGP
jgi:Flp pilus assembly protein TadG